MIRRLANKRLRKLSARSDTKANGAEAARLVLSLGPLVPLAQEPECARRDARGRGKLMSGGCFQIIM